MAEVVDQEFSVTINPQISLVPVGQTGDVATNVALQLAGQLNMKPRDIADKLIPRLVGQPEVVSCEVAGPGFINIICSISVFTDTGYSVQNSDHLKKRILVEYSDPNPFKPLHAGHLYTTLVGDVIARLVEKSGAETIRLNYGGDVGLHVAKSMWGILQYLGEENPVLLDQILEADRPAWLGERYVEGNNAYEEDEQAKKDIISLNKKVYMIQSSQDTTSTLAQIYWICRTWSYDYFAVLYNQLQVTPFARFIPESEVVELGLSTVQAHLGDVYEQSDGAVIFDGERYGLHARVFVNSEGLPTYETKEIGLNMTKWQDYAYDTSLIITANEQTQYMQVVLKSIEQFEPEIVKRTTHLTHGIVKLTGGVKMSSRRGNTVTALEILESAREAGRASGTATDESTVLAAVKYAFLKHRLGGDIIYDPKESVALEGNSGPYLQYAHARARSILRKGALSADTELTEDIQDGERKLLRHVALYGDIIERATEECAPHHVCTYLFELAQEFNRFYEQHTVIGDPRESVRLQLVALYADTLKSGLELLGITAPQKM